jgi:hypothetical protein
MSDSEDRRQDRLDESALEKRAFDDPAHDEIRRLLSEARVTDAVPADVAARLDATLASLREERIADERATNVVQMRRRITRVLVAAAVVVVVGGGAVGIANLPRSGSGDSNASADSAGSRTLDQGNAEKSAPQASSPSGVPGAVAKALPRLTTARFGTGVSRLMRATYGTLDTRSPQGDTPQPPAASGDQLVQGHLAPLAPPVTATPTPAEGSLRDAALACPGPEAPDAVTWPARLDGALVALVFRPPTADAQVVEAWSCDGAALLASATVPH